MKRKKFLKRYLLVILSVLTTLSLFLSLPLFADHLVSVIADGEAVIGEDTTIAQARSLALNHARRSAIEKVSGIKVHGLSVVYNSQLISDLISAYSKGLIVKEEILIDDIKKEGKHISYSMRIKAHIKPLKYEKFKAFKIARAEVFRAGGGSISGNPVFQENDEIRIRVGLTADLYLNIFSVTQDGWVAKLFPNKYVKHAKISTHRSFIFPDDMQRSMGLKLRVHTPKNLSRAFETIIVVATKEKIDFLSGKDQDKITITDLMYELSGLDQSLWTTETIGYEVRR